MFENLNQKNDREVDDIFAETDKEGAAGQAMNQARPATPVAPMGMPRPAMPTMAKTPSISLEAEAKKSAGMGKVLKKLFTLIVVLALLAAAAYFIYSKFLVGMQEKSLYIPEQKENVVPQNEEDNNNIVPVVNEDEATTSITTTTPTLTDTDSDGLLDQDELILGTDANNVDTDGDGLSDFDEINMYKSSPLLSDSDADGLSDEAEISIYKTSPTNDDTDGDTYKDGAEVENGYNPNGAGRLE